MGENKSRCSFHPEREASGLCKSCGKLICVECANKLQGINFCVECISRIQKQTKTSTGGNAGKVPVAHRIGAMLVFIFIVGLGMAGAFGLPVFMADKGRETEASLRTKMAGVYAGLDDFYEDVKRFPTLEEGLLALLKNNPVDKDRVIPNWKGSYLKLEGDDFYDEEARSIYFPTGEVHYWAAKEEQMCFYYLASPGPDGKWDSTDIEKLEPLQNGTGDDIFLWLRGVECQGP